MASGVAELHAAEQPHDQQDDQHKAESSTKSRPSVAIISIVATSAAEQHDQQNDELHPSHDLHFSAEAYDRTGNQGVFCLADFSMAFPVAEMSSPAPAVVWEALSSGAMAAIESTARATMSSVDARKSDDTFPDLGLLLHPGGYRGRLERLLGGHLSDHDKQRQPDDYHLPSVKLRLIDLDQYGTRCYDCWRLAEGRICQLSQ